MWKKLLIKSITAVLIGTVVFAISALKPGGEHVLKPIRIKGISQHFRKCFCMDGQTIQAEKCPLNVLSPLCIYTLEQTCSHTPTSKNHDVTLTLQLSTCSFDRYSSLAQSCAQWSGPISAALFINSTLDTLSDTNPVSGNSWKDDIIQLLHSCAQMRISFIVPMRTQILYPVNAMRAIAISQSSTSHVFVMDSDFVPHEQAYEQVVVLLRNSTILRDARTAVIIPAFETTIASTPMPHSKLELLHLWDSQTVRPFALVQFPAGHRATDFKRFKNENTIYKVRFETGFEPYVIVERGAPLPDSRFVGWYKDKMHYIKALHAYRYEFYVLPSTFLLHYPHARHRLMDPQYKHCNLMLYKQSLNTNISMIFDYFNPSGGDRVDVGEGDLFSICDHHLNRQRYNYRAFVQCMQSTCVYMSATYDQLAAATLYNNNNARKFFYPESGSTEGDSNGK